MTTAAAGDVERPGNWPSRPTLGDLLEHLGIRVLDIVAAPDGLAVGIGETVVVGPGEPVPARPDGLLLATGTDPDGISAAIKVAGEQQYSAVIVKAFGADVAVWSRQAADAGIALLTTPDDMSWRHLDALLSGAAPVVGPTTDRFTTVGLGDLFSLANAIASGVGGALTIEDPHGRVLAYSNLPGQEIDEIRRSAILGRQTPERPTNHEEYQAVFAHDGPIDFPSPMPGHASRMAVALWAGRRPLGILWVITDRPALAPGANEVLAEAGKVAELHLLRMNSHRDPDRLRRTEFLRDLLNGRAPGRTDRSGLGLDAEERSQILAIAPRTPVAVGPTVPARIVDLVTLFCDGWDPRALCVIIDGVVYALLPHADTRVTTTPGRTDAVDPLRRMATDIVATAKRSADLELLVAIGPIAPTVAGIADSRHNADRVLQLLRQRAALQTPRWPAANQTGTTSKDADRTDVTDRAGGPASAVATVEDVLEQVVLLGAAEHRPIITELLLPGVRALLESDDTTGTPYAETLLEYLGNMGDIPRTAIHLNVHENTVRYRIRRAQELFGLQLSDADTLLVTWLQLRLSRIT